MSWFKKLFHSEPRAESKPSEAKGSTLLILPDAQFELAEKFATVSQHENDRIGREEMSRQNFSEALPRLLACFTQTGGVLYLLLMAQCSYGFVVKKAQDGDIDRDLEVVLSTGINAISKFIAQVSSNDAFPKKGEPFGVRANLLSLKAQIYRDPKALTAAEDDYKAAIKLGSNDSDNIRIWKGNLESMAQVRRALS